MKTAKLKRRYLAAVRYQQKCWRAAGGLRNHPYLRCAGERTFNYDLQAYGASRRASDNPLRWPWYPKCRPWQGKYWKVKWTR